MKPSEMPLVVNRGDAPRMTIYGVVDKINRTLDEIDSESSTSNIVAVDRDVLRLVAAELRRHQQKYCTGCDEALQALPEGL